jgi:hypothetical protein
VAEPPPPPPPPPSGDVVGAGVGVSVGAGCTQLPSSWRWIAAVSASRKSGKSSAYCFEIERRATLSAVSVWSQSSIRPSRSKSR